MDEARLSLFKAEVEAQRREIERIFAKIEERRKLKKDPFAVESLAYQLHNLYCAFEDLFKVVADYFENTVVDSKRYHRELLQRMRLTIEGVRPALLSEEAFKLLDSLRAFRHFFRHAYSYDLDPKKVELVLEEALRLKELYREEIDRFLRAFED